VVNPAIKASSLVTRPPEGNLTEIPTCEKQKKIEKTHAKESN